MEYNRVWAEINLDALLHNLEAMRENIDPDTKICAVVKTDAYGHGCVQIAKVLEDVDYIWGYATATVDEAMELRQHDIKKPILVLGYTFKDSYADMIKNDIRPTLFRMDMARDFSDEAVRLGIEAPVHIKIDTGMSRIGFQVEKDSVEEILSIFKFPNLIPEGIFTHFARSDEEDKTAAREQLELFRQMIHALSDEGLTFAIHHCSNSAAILELPEANMEMVRAGVTMYGMWPSDEIDHSFDLEPVLSLKSRVVHIKELPAGREVSYSGTYTTTEDTMVATIPIGYGDGYPRSLSSKGYVLIHGQKAPILGRVCMDQLMVDITGIEDVNILDEVTLIGTDGNRQITIEEVGDLSGRFNYEFACCLGDRIPRIYYLDGKEVARLHFFK